MKLAVVTIIMATSIVLASGAIAQTPQDDRRMLPSRSIQLTVQQEYVIRENVKDMHVNQDARTSGIRVGERLPSNIETHDFPLIVVEKVPKVEMYKFFITENEIVLVGPQKEIADLIKLVQ